MAFSSTKWKNCSYLFPRRKGKFIILWRNKTAFPFSNHFSSTLIWRWIGRAWATFIFQIPCSTLWITSSWSYSHQCHGERPFGSWNILQVDTRGEENSMGVTGSRGVITECSVESPELLLGLFGVTIKKTGVKKWKPTKKPTKTPPNKHREVQLEQPEWFTGFGWSGKSKLSPRGDSWAVFMPCRNAAPKERSCTGIQEPGRGFCPSNLLWSDPTWNL